MATVKTDDEILLDEVQARFDALTKDWPYDLNEEMTDKQLAEQGANDVTDQNTGVGVIATHK